MLKSAAKKCSSFLNFVLKSAVLILFYNFYIFDSSWFWESNDIKCVHFTLFHEQIWGFKPHYDTMRLWCKENPMHMCLYVHIIRVHSDKQKKGKFALLHTILCIWRNHIFICELKQHWPHMIPSSAIIVISVHHMMHSDTISSMRWDVVN